MWEAIRIAGYIVYGIGVLFSLFKCYVSYDVFDYVSYDKEVQMGYERIVELLRIGNRRYKLYALVCIPILPVICFVETICKAVQNLNKKEVK